MGTVFNGVNSLYDDMLYFQSLIPEYINSYEELKTRVSKDIVSIDYASGGISVHRGWHLPSPTMDIVVGNAGRGRKTKRRTNRTMYQYGYDAAARLICVERVGEPHVCAEEFILYNDNRSIGAEYWNGWLDFLSLCEYDDGKITSYSRCFLNNGTINILQKEMYNYDRNGLVSMERIEVMLAKDMRRAKYEQRDRYVFEHDAEGYLSRYQLVDDAQQSADETVYWDVYIKRKV